MKTFDNIAEAKEYSMFNPDELVKYSKYCHQVKQYCIGHFLNTKREGAMLWKSTSNDICYYFFYRNNIMHGEYKRSDDIENFNYHCFYVNGYHLEDLDYLLVTDRDEAFYVTLALYGIDKEHTIQE